MKSLVLDTHVFLWLLEGNPKLPGALRQAIDDPASDLYLPVLVVAEMVDLISKGRSPLSSSDLDLALHSDPHTFVSARPLAADS
jgi:PIN domain nuclease of toxin-antitoxin system